MTGNWQLATDIAWAMGLGVGTAISPCPLAANIAAISYAARRVGKPRLALVGGAFFVTGQLAAYVGLAALLAYTLLSQAAVAAFLQRYLPKAIGPLMIIVGVLLLELVPISMGRGVNQQLRRRAESMGLAGELLLGFILALAFCPTTAALYFGQLLPLALKSHSPIILAIAFGIGAAVPIMIMAGILALAANRIGTVYSAVSVFERWARRIAGSIFVAAGIYLTLVHVYRLAI